MTVIENCMEHGLRCFNLTSTHAQIAAIWSRSITIVIKCDIAA